jgi:hypothetical protein
MFDFDNYRWYHWLLFTAFVISLPWLWWLYLLLLGMLAYFWALGSSTSGSTGAYIGSSHRPRGRPRSTAYKPTRWRPKRIRAQQIKPYRAPRVRKPRVYKGRTLKSGVRSTYDPVFKKWRNQARHSTWRPPLD